MSLIELYKNRSGWLRQGWKGKRQNFTSFYSKITLVTTIVSTKVKNDESINNETEKDENDQKNEKVVKIRYSKQVQPNLDYLKGLNATQNNVGIWNCCICQDSPESLGKVSFEHKFQLVTHWFENHSDNSITYEVCQWCLEVFSSPGYLKEVRKTIFKAQSAQPWTS